MTEASPKRAGSLFGTVRKALGLIDQSRRRRMLLVGVLALIVSGFEVIAALLVLVLLRLVLEPGAAMTLPLVGDIGRFFPDSTKEDLVLYFAATFAVFFLVRGGLFLFQQHALTRVAENTGVLLADRLVSGYLSMPYEFHLQRNSAELVRNAYDNVQQVVVTVFGSLVGLFAEIVLVAAMLTVLVIASPSATAGAAILIGLTMFLILRGVQPRLKRLGRVRQTAAQAALMHLQQGLQGLRDVKVLGREKVFARSFRQVRAEMSAAQYRRTTLAYVPRVGLETAFLLFVLAAVTWATYRGTPGGTLSTLDLFAYAGMRLQPSLQKISAGLNDLRYSEAIVDDLRADLSLFEAAPPLREADATSVLPLHEKVTFEDVSYQYPGGTKPALEHVDVTIRHGESVGICGQTGGGKTTFLDLLCGLLTPTHGRICVDSVDLATDVRAWQRAIGVVHQSSFLIDDTLRRNIALGVADAEIDEAALDEAVSIAQLQDVIQGMPQGLHTVVGERGVRLSGGQRQRVTLARAIYRKPSLVILDEGTSALDTATEAAVVAGLEQLRGSVTLVMVAHRLSSIRDCDRIFFLQHGSLVATGTFDELCHRSVAFQEMAQQSV